MPLLVGVTVTFTLTLLVACTKLTWRLAVKKLVPVSVKVDATAAYSVPEILVNVGSSGEKPFHTNLLS